MPTRGQCVACLKYKPELNNIINGACHECANEAKLTEVSELQAERDMLRELVRIKDKVINQLMERCDKYIKEQALSKRQD